MQVGIPRTLHSVTALDSLSGHMADPQCNLHLEYNGTVWYRVQRRNGVCGNVMRVRSVDFTAIIIQNLLFR